MQSWDFTRSPGGVSDPYRWAERQEYSAIGRSPAVAIDQSRQFSVAGRGAEDSPAVPGLGSVPRGTSLPSSVAKAAEGPAAAELVAPAWYT
ncbi:hypothetical protein D9M71_617540 [compost metagenome]